MTWKELKAAIDKLPKKMLNNEVMYAEPYDDGEIHAIDLTFAKTDIPSVWGHYADTNDYVPIAIEKGEPYLW